MSSTEQVTVRIRVNVDRFAAAMRLVAASAIRTTPALRRFRRAVLRARKKYQILERRERQQLVQLNRRPQLIHKGGKP